MPASLASSFKAVAPHLRHVLKAWGIPAASTNALPKTARRPSRRHAGGFVAFTPAANQQQLALPLFFMSPASEPDPFENYMRVALVLGYSVAHLRQDGVSQRADIASRISQSGSPFPPLLFAKGQACIAAQEWVESNPLSGLVLVDPSEEEEKAAGYKFRFEPYFPVVLVDSGSPSSVVAQHRLLRDFKDDVDLIKLDKDTAFLESGFDKIRQWMDENRL